MDAINATTSATTIAEASRGLLGDYGVILASATALFLGGGGGRWITQKFYKPCLKILDLQIFRQAHDVLRLVIRNEGNDTAENVQVDVTKIFDEGESRKNFLPMPLLWTHLGREERNILQKQTVYLDIINWNTEGNSLSDLMFIPELATRYGGGIDDFRKLKSGKSKLELTFYERGGKVFLKKLEIAFDGGLIYDFRIEGQKWYWASKKKDHIKSI